MKAEPVWASLTGAETALVSVTGMTKTVISRLVADSTRIERNDDTVVESYLIAIDHPFPSQPRLSAKAWNYHNLCSGTYKHSHRESPHKYMYQEGI